MGIIKFLLTIGLIGWWLVLVVPGFFAAMFYTGSFWLGLIITIMISIGLFAFVKWFNRGI